MLEELAPAVLELDSRFDTSGRTGANFSRINRDIRFAKDKTLYKTHMYLKFSVPPPAKRETGQLYVGLTTDTVTAGFRIYSGGKRKDSTIALIAEPRVIEDSRWVAKQKARLGRRYESYWYKTVKGEWTPSGHRYLSAYEIEGDPRDVMRELDKEVASGRMKLPDWFGQITFASFNCRSHGNPAEARLADHLYLVFSAPPEGLPDDEFVAWYREHADENTQVPGFLAN